MIQVAEIKEVLRAEGAFLMSADQESWEQRDEGESSAPLAWMIDEIISGMELLITAKLAFSPSFTDVEDLEKTAQLWAWAFLEKIDVKPNECRDRSRIRMAFLSFLSIGSGWPTSPAKITELMPKLPDLKESWTLRLPEDCGPRSPESDAKNKAELEKIYKMLGVTN